MSETTPPPAENGIALDEQPMEVRPFPLGVSARAPVSNAPMLCALAIEVWRVKSRLSRALPLLPPKEGRPLETSVLRMEELLVEARVTIDDPTGRPYADGERHEVLLFEAHADVTRPTIAQTVKPAVFVDGVLFKPAEVIVATPPAGAVAP